MVTKRSSASTTSHATTSRLSLTPSVLAIWFVCWTDYFSKEVAQTNSVWKQSRTSSLCASKTQQSLLTSTSRHHQLTSCRDTPIGSSNTSREWLTRMKSTQIMQTSTQLRTTCSRRSSWLRNATRSTNNGAPKYLLSLSNRTQMPLKLNRLSKGTQSHTSANSGWLITLRPWLTGHHSTSSANKWMRKRLSSVNTKMNSARLNFLQLTANGITVTLLVSSIYHCLTFSPGLPTTPMFRTSSTRTTSCRLTCKKNAELPTPKSTMTNLRTWKHQSTFANGSLRRLMAQ